MKTMKRDHLVAQVEAGLPSEAINDLPMIRQAINDTSDAYRKDGWSVGDFEQDRMVADIQLRMRRTARRNNQ